MSKPTKDLLDSYSTLLKVIRHIQITLQGSDVHYETDEGSWPVKDIVNQASLLLSKYEEMPDLPPEPPSHEDTAFREAVEQVMSSTCPSLHLTRAPGDPMIYLNITDKWTRDMAKTFSALSVTGVFAEAASEMKDVFAFAAEKGVNLR